MKVSVVTPVFNAETTLPLLVSRLEPVLQEACSSYEVVLVDDGSRDGSWDVIRELSSRHPWVRGIQLMRNYGQHNALLCGVRAATGEVVVTMDDDLQHPPEEIPKLLEGLSKPCDVVYGVPRELPHSFARNLFSRLTKLSLYGLTGRASLRHVSAFRAFRGRLREVFREYRGSDVLLDVLLSWGTQRFEAVEVRHDARTSGRTNYSFAGLVDKASHILTGTSIVPLRLASFLGLLFSLAGALFLAYVVARFYLEGGKASGFPFLAATIALFSGAQLLGLGIIGEYLARVHFRVMERPAYAIASTTSSDPLVAPGGERPEPAPPKDRHGE